MRSCRARGGVRLLSRIELPPSRYQNPRRRARIGWRCHFDGPVRPRSAGLLEGAVRAEWPRAHVDLGARARDAEARSGAEKRVPGCRRSPRAYSARDELLGVFAELYDNSTPAAHTRGSAPSRFAPRLTAALYSTRARAATQTPAPSRARSATRPRYRFGILPQEHTCCALTATSRVDKQWACIQGGAVRGARGDTFDELLIRDR